MVKLHNKPLLQNKELKVIKCEKTRSEKHRAEIENGREYRQIIWIVWKTWLKGPFQ